VALLTKKLSWGGSEKNESGVVFDLQCAWTKEREEVGYTFWRESKRKKEKGMRSRKAREKNGGMFETLCMKKRGWPETGGRACETKWPF